MNVNIFTNSPFMPPKKKYYLGKIKFGTPYFYPRKFNSTIIRIRKEPLKYSGNKMFKLFNRYIYVGWPFWKTVNELGWKDKYGPRFEWCPALYLFFFKWQFCIWWVAPDGEDSDYYEMFLWWKYYYEEYGCNEPDIVEAEKNWPWRNSITKKSTWNKNYVL